MKHRKIKIGFISTNFIEKRFIGDFTYEDRQIYTYLSDYLGQENVFILNPININVFFTKDDISIFYEDQDGIIPHNIFEKLDGLIIRRTRGFSEQLKDILNAIHNKFPNLSMFDPIEVFQDPLSKFSSFLKRQTVNLPQPNTLFLYNLNISDIKIIKETIRTKVGFPLIVKPIKGHLGIGVEVCENEDKLADTLEKLIKKDLEEVETLGHGIIVQKFIDAEEEYRVIVINGKSIGCAKKISKEKIKNAFRGARFKIVEDKKAEELAEKSAKVQNIFFAGVDIIKDKEDNYYVIECNRSPLFFEFDQTIKNNTENVASIFVKEVIKEILKKQKHLTTKKSINLNKSSEYDIFLCYTNEDIDIALSLLEELSKRQLRVWIDYENVKSGNDLEKIEEAIKNSLMIVVLISENTIKKLFDVKSKLIPATITQINEIDFIAKNEDLLNKTIFFIMDSVNYKKDELIDKIIEEFPKLRKSPFHYFENNNINEISEEIRKAFEIKIKERIEKNE